MPDDIKTQLQDATGNPSTPSVEDTTVTPGTDAGVPQTVSLEAFNEVLTRMKATHAELENLKGGMAFVEKVKQVLTDDKPQMSPRDKMIKDELYRLVPGLQYLENVPQLLEQINKTAAENRTGIADDAWSYQQGLQKDINLATDDPEVSQMLGVQIREWIGADQARQRRFRTGDKTVIKEGFEHVVGKLYGPDRLARKRNTVAKSQSMPVTPSSRGGGAGEPAKPEPALNFRQPPGAVRKDVKTALRAFAQTMGREAE